MFRLRHPKTPEIVRPQQTPPTHWENMRFVLGRIGTTWLADMQGALEFDRELRLGRYRQGSPYESVGDFLHNDLRRHAVGLDLAKVLHSSHVHSNDTEVDRLHFTKQLRDGVPGIGHGFRVMGRVLSFAVPAYRELTGDFRTLNDTDHLEAILREPESFNNTVNFVAKQLDTKYGFRPIAAWEKRLHLLEDHPLEERAGTPFIINPSSGKEAYDINPLWAEGLESVPGQGCPARDVLLMKIWGHMIDMAVESDYLFRAELPQQ